MDRFQYGIECFKNGLNCSQAVLVWYAEALGIDRETALKISCGFGGGMLQGDTCGAVTGALMTIGLKYGQRCEGDKEGKEKTYAMIKEFSQKFKCRRGTTICRELLKCDIWTEEGRKLANEKELFFKVCPGFISDAIDIVEEIL